MITERIRVISWSIRYTPDGYWISKIGWTNGPKYGPFQTRREAELKIQEIKK